MYIYSSVFCIRLQSRPIFRAASHGPAGVVPFDCRSSVSHGNTRGLLPLLKPSFIDPDRELVTDWS